MRRISPAPSGALLLLLVLLPLPGAAAAQSVIRGTLIDDGTEAPIEGARIRLLEAGGRGRASVVTDAEGGFLLPPAPAGAYRLDASRLGYRSVTTPPLRLAEQDTLVVEVRLSTEVVVLAPVEVVARVRRPGNAVLSGFRERQERGIGTFLGREEIERRNPFYLSDVLAGVPGLRLGNRGARGGRSVYMVRTVRAGCSVQIYLDGQLVNRPIADRISPDSSGAGPGTGGADFTIDEVVSPSHVEGIEIYQGISEVPGEFAGPNAHCGVIAVWTRSGDR